MQCRNSDVHKMNQCTHSVSVHHHLAQWCQILNASMILWTAFGKIKTAFNKYTFEVRYHHFTLLNRAPVIGMFCLWSVYLRNVCSYNCNYYKPWPWWGVGNKVIYRPNLLLVSEYVQAQVKSLPLKNFEYTFNRNWSLEIVFAKLVFGIRSSRSAILIEAGLAPYSVSEVGKG